MEGLARGVRNVPVIFINDQLFEQAITVEQLSKAVGGYRRRKAA
jgi:protein-disulfide isomerase